MTPKSENYGLVAGIVLLHFGGAYIGLTKAYKTGFFDTVNIQKEAFFSQLIVTGVFLYALALAVSLLWFKICDLWKTALAISCLSVVAATLIGHDAYNGSGELPKNFWTMFYLLLTDRQPLLLLGLLTLGGSIALIYFIIRAFFGVSYDGAGIQIKMPGQVSYFLPVYPQMCWQDTKIDIQTGEKFQVEISGLVCPGGLLSLDKMAEYTQKVLRANEKNKLAAIPEPPKWPYTTARGYRKRWYRGNTKLEVLKQHEYYCEDDYYLKDPGLTVKGLTHNTVVAIIMENNEKPLQASRGQPAYDWFKVEHQEKLVNLSSSQYPISFEAKQTGRLWVAINDVDYARWDNTGLFFLRLTRNSWFKK
jgi:hypothetical protein